MTLRACDTSLGYAPRSRLLAALCASGLVHFCVPLAITGGHSGSSSAPAAARMLSVRIVPAVADPAPQPAVEHAPQSDEPRVEPVTRPPQQVARAAQASEARTKQQAGSAMTEAPDLTYYAAKQLDVYPVLSGDIDLRYRGKAAEHGISGRALLLVMIDETGTVNDVSVIEAEPANYFEDDAKRAFLSARFTPAYRNGRPVRSRVLVEVNYGVERASR
jgi:protein TonB